MCSYKYELINFPKYENSFVLDFAGNLVPLFPNKLVIDFSSNLEIEIDEINFIDEYIIIEKE